MGACVGFSEEPSQRKGLMKPRSPCVPLSAVHPHMPGSHQYSPCLLWAFQKLNLHFPWSNSTAYIAFQTLQKQKERNYYDDWLDWLSHYKSQAVIYYPLNHDQGYWSNKCWIKSHFPPGNVLTYTSPSQSHLNAKCLNSKIERDFVSLFIPLQFISPHCSTASFRIFGCIHAVFWYSYTHDFKVKRMKCLCYVVLF